LPHEHDTLTPFDINSYRYSTNLSNTTTATTFQIKEIKKKTKQTEINKIFKSDAELFLVGIKAQ